MTYADWIVLFKVGFIKPVVKPVIDHQNILPVEFSVFSDPYRYTNYIISFFYVQSISNLNIHSEILSLVKHYNLRLLIGRSRGSSLL